MTQPYLALRPTGNGMGSHYIVAGSKNPTVLTVGVSKKSACEYAKCETQVVLEEVLKEINLNELKKTLDAYEDDMYTHQYQFETEFLGFKCKEICLFNMLIHRELGIPYESFYKYGEPRMD